jgi:hypothetical protein
MEWQKNYNDLYRKFMVITNALRIAAKYARENIPAEIPTDQDYLLILAGGAERDPEGKEYLEKWLYEAEQKVKGIKI